jgi:hypothetical protein
VSGRHRLVVAVCLSIVAITVVTLWQPGPRARQKPVADSEKVHTDPKTGEKYRIVGGVRRSLYSTNDSDRVDAGDPKDPPLDPIAALVGQTPIIPPNANPMVASVVEAYRTKSHPERLSSSIIPAPFDAGKYASTPAAYLNIVEPGRIWQSAPPGPDVTPIKAASPRLQRVPQKETASLKVKVTPNAPVTFTSFDLGEFQNRLTSITVAADEEGLAVARFTGTPGTANHVNILAASPVTSGQLHFIVDVVVPGLNDPRSIQVTTNSAR